MNLETVNAVAQLIAATGVIVSLFYLAAQIRQNTKSQRSVVVDFCDNVADFIEVSNEEQMLGLLLNGQPFSALLNLALIVPCLIFGLVFHVLLLVPSIHAVIAVHMKRENRKHREMIEAIERHGAPPGWKP